MIDLHTHSSQSDGTLAPGEIVREAQRIGLRAVALTDHDTTAGICEFLDVGRDSEVCCIPGVEISVQGKGSPRHIVGLFINHRNPRLQSLLDDIRRWRRERNLKMLEKLRGLGLPLDDDALKQAGANAVPGRPHFARALVLAGVCHDNREAFRRFLGRSAPGFVPRALPDARSGIMAIRAAGGLAFWAHPLTSRSMTNACFRRTLRELRDIGLAGVEAYYSEFSYSQTTLACEAAGELGMLVSGGSDFHGDNIPEIALGTGYGKLNVPDNLLDPLFEHVQNQ